ncbi:hypothetical protein N9Y92_02450 [Chlamydiales bacterium]|nr:hypothetical protein [Chlamydiales bacterium]
MKKMLFYFLLLPTLILANYHDQIVYDKVDDYYQTMFEAIEILNKNAFNTPQDKNTFIHWVNTKDHMSDELAQVLTSYFLQKKIAPSIDSETTKLIQTIHKLLFLIEDIKQQVSIKVIEDFGITWNQFKELRPPNKNKKIVYEESF